MSETETKSDEEIEARVVEDGSDAEISEGVASSANSDDSDASGDAGAGAQEAAESSSDAAGGTASDAAAGEVSAGEASAGEGAAGQGTAGQGAAPTGGDALGDALRQAEEWKSKAYRTAADMENFRRRVVKEKDDLRKFAIEGLLKDLFPVVDNLERAVAHSRDGEDPLVKGVRMVLQQFSTELQKYGARAFDPLGEAFDPSLHEAMTQMESADVPAGHVLQVFQRGWMLHDRLVRPAMVVVAKAPPEPGE